MATDGDVCFYTISNAPYFPGLVALINSLILTGHTQTIRVGDCGLTPAQRKVLAGCRQVELVELDPAKIRNPGQYKAFAHIANASGIAVIIDSDMIVTGSLAPLIAQARQGGICAFPNPIDDRWHAQWEEIFALQSPPRRQTYVCSGFVAFSTDYWPDLLARWWQACEAIHSHPTYQEGSEWDSPTAQSDQDALNAILMSEYATDAVSLAPVEKQVYRWDFRFLETRDAHTLDCRFQEHTPLILHAALTSKPWEEKGASNDTYFIFLRRLLLGRDVAIRLPADLLTPVTASGLMPWLHRQSCFVKNMGVIEYALSCLPPVFCIRARRIKDRLREKYLQWRKKDAPSTAGTVLLPEEVPTGDQARSIT
ncbi:hypothetical protein [Novacetimonas maltaceti]|uniref:Glycosyl transferase family 8 n=1 Tax=Novacetimonas maltaceti TaxID=1203393 RepID=A0A2S3W5N4_9PROT|nr:hypothetical protein [Novacetimonas maltaceti]POF64185.1 hypothetical protein KMAL_00790 [Novacetimonas maltaceti]